MKLEIIIGGKTLDITNDSNFYQTIDFNNIYDNQAMKISYSDKFDIPLTKNNSEILGVNLLTNGDYTTPFKLLSCEVRQDGVTTMEDALLRIESIDYTENLARCYIKSGDVDFGQRISGLNLGVVDGSSALRLLLNDEIQDDWVIGNTYPLCPTDILIYSSEDSEEAKTLAISTRSDIPIYKTESIKRGSAMYSVQSFLNYLFSNFGVALNMTSEATDRLDGIYMISTDLKRSIELGRNRNAPISVLIYADGTVRNELGGSEVEPIITGNSIIKYDITEVYDQNARFHLICNGDVRRVFALNQSDSGKIVDYLEDDETEIDVVSSSFADDEAICKMQISRVESEENNVLINLENSFDDIKIEDFLESLQLLYGLKIEYVGQTANIKVAEDIEDIVFNDLSEKLNQVQKREFEPSEYGKSFTYTLDYPDWTDKVGDGGIKRNSRLSEGTENDIEVAPFYAPTGEDIGLYSDMDISLGKLDIGELVYDPQDFTYKNLDGLGVTVSNVYYSRQRKLTTPIAINNVINNYYSSRLPTLKKEIQLTVEMILTPFDIVSLKENNFIYLKQTSRRYQVVNIDKYNPEQLTTVTLLEIQQ